MLKFVLLSVAFLASSAHSAPRTGEPIQPIEAFQAENPAKVHLGKMLFFDPRLSKSAFISCNSCHNLSMGGADNRDRSIGHGWKTGSVNSPTVLNSSLHIAQFWDGRAKDLKEQAAGPIANPIEMASTHDVAVGVIASIEGYGEEFKKVYGDSKVTLDRITDAIAAFEETLVTPNSRFDRWLKGDDLAINAAEKKGYELFKERGCVGCHNGPAVGGNMFQKFGLVHAYTKDKENLGRYNVTKQEQDKYVFKVPSLRNIEMTYPYFHDGSVWSLEEAVEVMAWHQLGLKLSVEEKAAMVAFLKTLTGQMPKIELPILPPSSIKTVRPAL
jgi:cytochrome c peroxidase